MASLKRTLSGCSSSKVSKKQHLDPTLEIFSGMSRTIVEECGMDFLPTDGEKAWEILKNIRLLRWESFVKNPGGYVKVFYENLDKERRTSTVRGLGSNTFSDPGTSWCRIPELSISMPPPTLDPMPFSNEPFFSNATTISRIATPSIPITLFNGEPSVTAPHREKNNFDADFDFFQDDGTCTSGY